MSQSERTAARVTGDHCFFFLRNNQLITAELVLQLQSELMVKLVCMTDRIPYCTAEVSNRPISFLDIHIIL